MNHLNDPSFTQQNRKSTHSRSSFSLSTRRPVSSVTSSPHSASMPALRCTSGDSSIHSSTSSTTTMISQSSLSSILSSSDEENEQITAVSGRKLMAPVKVIIQNDKNQYNLYEDIWMDSPIIREYLNTLENWLLQYLTWLEKVQQCRQLEIAYNKAISLLHEQTKLVLSQPFYTSEECEKLHWLDKEEEDMCDNEEIGNILSDLTEHGKNIKDTLEYNKGVISAARTKYIQLSNTYCATQKTKASSHHKQLDEITSSLYQAKRSLSKLLVTYIQKIYGLIRSTRELLNKELAPLFEGLESDKHRNLKALEKLVLAATEFIYNIDIDSLSFDQECNGERLSHYISQKSASYYRFLNSKDDHLYTSGSSDIPFSNTPRIIPRYNSIELLFTQQSLIIHQMSTRGYLLMKRNSKDTAPNYTGKWERHYFYISKNDGHLKQYKNQSVSVTLVNLKHAAIQALESEKRSYVIQISLARDDFCIQLQSETSKDYSYWLDSLSAWNNSKVIRISSELRSKNSATSGSRFLSKKSILSESASAIENLSTVSCKSSGSMELGSSDLTLGYSISINESSINCCGNTVSSTGMFKIYKSCISKMGCSSQQHTGELCVVHITLFENNMIHLQTERASSEFFHLPIQLSLLESHNLYSFSDHSHMKHSIVIRPSFREVYHLLTNDRIHRDIWLTRLKNGCSRASRKVQCLTVRIGECRRISTKDSFLFCDLAIDHEIRGLTGSLKKMSTCSWREDFVFPDISQISYGISVNIFTKSNKNDRESNYGHVFIPLEQLPLTTSLQESWYEIRKENNKHRTFASLAGLGSAHVPLGDLRIGLLLQEHKVLPLEAYGPLIDVLKNFNHKMIYDMARKTSDMQALAKNLLRIYEGMGLALSWVKSLIDHEVDSLTLDDANILFRGNSFFTKVIDSYMKMTGKNFLEEALQPTIEKICKAGLYIEVEPSRLSNTSEDETRENCVELFKNVRFIWKDVQKAKTKCPNQFRQMFGHLKSAVVKKFDLEKDTLERHHQVARYTCVSGFVFLRWICPAIISPKQFDLVQDHPDTNTCRTLTLIAKCLMTLASHITTEQNSKELWINQLNMFINNNTTNFTDFINHISVSLLTPMNTDFFFDRLPRKNN
ncbi:unnamed protein product [Rhizopus stolonifer]